MSLELLGRKLGMTQIFNDAGDRVPVTVIEAGPCTVVRKRTQESDGYSAVQLGFERARDKQLTKPKAGHFAKAGVEATRHLFECRVGADELEGLEVGSAIDASRFEAGQKVDVSGRTKGRGFTGVIKRHNYRTSKKTHGTHEFFRHAGGLSAGTYPGRILPGKKMAGHDGDKRVTTIGLRVERVDAERNLIFVRGAVPGHPNALVRIRSSVRGSTAGA